MKTKIMSLVAGATVLSGTAAFAATTTFGPQPGDTFASTTIDNSAVERTAITVGNTTIDLDLTSTGRGATAPLVTHPGSTAVDPLFHATAGHTVQYGLNLPLWTFDYAITVNNNAFNAYTYKLVYSDAAGSASFDPSKATVSDDSFSSVGGVTSEQNDENLGFATGLPGGFPALPGGFNPDAGGVYTITLEAFNRDNTLVGSDSITVDVVSAPDASTTMGLLGVCASGLLAVSRKIKRA